MCARSMMTPDAAPFNAPISPSPLTLPTHILGVTDQSAGGRAVAGSAVSALIIPRVIIWHNSNITATTLQQQNERG